MSTPLFDILKRNLAVPDVDRGEASSSQRGSRRGMRRALKPETIAAFKLAYKLHNEQGMSRWMACKKGTEATGGGGVGSIYASWGKYEVRLREEGLL